MTKPKTKTKKTTKMETPVSTTTELTNKLIQLLLDRPDLVSFKSEKQADSNTWSCKVANVDVYAGSFTALLVSDGIRVHISDVDAENLIVAIKERKSSSMLASVYEATAEPQKPSHLFSFLFG